MLVAALWIAASSNASGTEPKRNMWVTYAPHGSYGTTEPQADGNVVIGHGDLGAPIFSLRLRSATRADLATPGGFDSYHLRASDVHEENFSGNAHSDSGLREELLRRALTHHRPIMTLRLDQKGQRVMERSAKLRRFEACALPLMRAALEAHIATAENEHQRELQRQRLHQSRPLGLPAPVDQSLLLLRLVSLSIPDAAGPLGAAFSDGGARSGPVKTQYDWRAAQVRAYGRPARLQLDLMSAGRTSAADLCRSLTYEKVSSRRSDTCTIQGIFDRRDGWPITLFISRKAQFQDGTTESRSWLFQRLTPLEGFVPYSNPCLDA
jgi:hypothetical protein